MLVKKLITCLVECFNGNTYMEHENINQEEASMQEFIFYVFHLRDAINLDSNTDFKFALTEQ
jgi:hypothetical protein